MKRVNRQGIYNGQIIKLYKDEVLLENGNKTVREVVSHYEGAAVVAVDQEGRILMVRQHRYPINTDLDELPAGLIDEGESPLEAAKRELLEETGYQAKHWKNLISFYSSPGCHDEVIHLFAASHLKKVAEQNLDTNEELTFCAVPYDEVLEDVYSGKIKDGKTIIGILLYEGERKKA